MSSKSYSTIRDKEDPGRVFEDFTLAAGLNVDLMVKAKQAQIMAAEYKRLKETELSYMQIMGKRMQDGIDSLGDPECHCPQCKRMRSRSIH